MTARSRRLTLLAMINLIVGGVAVLFWLAIALVACLALTGGYAGKQPPEDWQEKVELVPVAAGMAIVLCGPAFLAAGIGLLKRRRWARVMTTGLGSVVGVLVVAGVALVCFDPQRAGPNAARVLLFLAG